MEYERPRGVWYRTKTVYVLSCSAAKRLLSHSNTQIAITSYFLLSKLEKMYKSICLPPLLEFPKRVTSVTVSNFSHLCDSANSATARCSHQLLSDQKESEFCVHPLSIPSGIAYFNILKGGLIPLMLGAPWTTHCPHNL